MTELPTPDAAQTLAEALLAWFAAHRRALPWRDDPRPYRVWISEIMLQQTQVATVLPYFERWMARFPDVATLAAAEIDEVLSAWSGLGYYSRAHNIHRAAAQIVEAHEGELPDEHGALLALPGVGRYTAGAIASIAFQRSAAIVDGNVIRVLARHFGVAGDPSQSSVQKRFWALADALVPTVRPGDFNQALMELGALVCRPRNPQCPACPLKQSCRALAEHRVDELPSPKAKRRRHRIVEAGVVVRRGTEDEPAYLLVRRRGPLLAGLWSVPTLELVNVRGRQRKNRDGDGASDWFGTAARACVGELVESLVGSAASAMRPLQPIDHGFTHIEYTLVPWLVTVDVLPATIAEVGSTAFDRHRAATREDLVEIGTPAFIERLFRQL